MAGSSKLFSYNQKYYQVIGIYPLEANQNSPSFNWKNWIFIISFVLYALSSTQFLLFETKSMLERGISFFGASAGVHWTCIYLPMIWQIKNTGPFVENWEQFIKKRENSTIVYRESVEKIERLCEWVGYAGIGTILVLTPPFLLYSLLNYYILDLGEKSFVLLFPVKLPFGSTPLWYFMAWAAQTAECAACALTCVTLVNFVFGSCWLFIIIAEDITKDLTDFNEQANANPSELMKRFCDIVQLYSDAKECVEQFNTIVKYSLFSLIFLMMLSVSSLLLTLQFQLMDENTKLFEALIVSVLAFWIFGTLFVINELGERMTYQFDLFREELERCDWHTLPIQMQRMYMLFLADTQQPKHIKCFGNVICLRDTFKKIIKSGFSYFTTLRQFEV